MSLLVDGKTKFVFILDNPIHAVLSCEKEVKEREIKAIIR
jgi:hypothetical protein